MSARILASMGRGGVGKTTFMALAARFLRDGQPILLIDADPDESLAEAVGVDYGAEGVCSVSEVLLDIRRKDVDTATEPLWDRIKYRFYREALYEGEGFDLFSLGSKWGQGCYCAPNDALKNIISELAGSYRMVLVDAPAGLEHLNRRVSSTVHDIFEILDTSRKASAHARRSLQIAEDVKIQFEHLYFVSNWRCGEGPPDGLPEGEKLSYAGRIDRDEEVEKALAGGRSLFDIPEDSPACVSVQNILRAAGILG